MIGKFLKDFPISVYIRFCQVGFGNSFSKTKVICFGRMSIDGKNQITQAFMRTCLCLVPMKTDSGKSGWQFMKTDHSYPFNAIEDMGSTRPYHEAPEKTHHCRRTTGTT